MLSLGGAAARALLACGISSTDAGVTVAAAASRVTVATAASQTLGQDLSERFRIYAAPISTNRPLALDEAPLALDVTKPRGEVHRDGDWHRSIHLWLADANGRLLLQRRSLYKDTHPGMLDVSCAGHITEDDGVTETAVREAEEELGLRLSVAQLESAWLGTLPSVASGETATHGRFLCREFQELFVLRCADGERLLDQLALDADEVAGVEWRPAAEVIAAWAADDSEFVGRPEHYRCALADALL